MRTAILFAGACLFCLSQPGLADGGYLKLSKAGGDYSTLMGDRNDCLNAASYGRFWAARNGGLPTSVKYRFETFVGCMKGKDYRLDTNGYRAAWYYYDYDHHYALLPNKPVHN